MINKQHKLLLELQNKGYNIVTCGNCGAVIIHKTGKHKLHCYDCGFSSDVCDFPDLFTKEANNDKNN